MSLPFSITAWRMINTLIHHLDPEAFAPLTLHKNKILCFEVQPSLIVTLQIDEMGLKVIENTALLTKNVTFSGPLSAFIAMIFHKEQINHGLHIKGDMELAKALYDTWQNMDLDWEGQLANCIGPQVAFGLSSGFSTVKSWAQKMLINRKNDAATYLQDEANILPHPKEVELLFKKIDTLRHDVERLEAKCKLLFNQFSSR